MSAHGEDVRLGIYHAHRLIAEGLAALLAPARDLTVVGIASSIEEVVDLVEQERPDIVLLDCEANGIAATEATLATIADTRVVMLTSLEADIVVRAVDAGVTGFVTKDSSPASLVEAVRLAASGEAVIPPVLLPHLLPGLRGTSRAGITMSDREREILELLARGASNDQIAASLYLSPHTVRNHLSRIYARLGARSRLEAVAVAVREGLIRYP